MVIFGVSLKQIIEYRSEYQIARNEYRDLREIAINFDALFEINPNVVGWITLSDSTIDYPIVQGQDNIHYLQYTFSGQRNPSGAIFLDYRDKSNFHSDARIYGHNMMDGSMFSTLPNWSGDSFIINTPNETLKFSVTWRGAMSLADVRSVDGMALITCVNGRPDLRFVVRAEKI